MDFKNAIKTRLDELAEKDSLFAKTYAKENKNLDDCCKYIIQEVSKKRKNECCVAMEDSEVINMAIHYYDEDSIDVNKKETPKVEISTAEESKKTEPQKTEEPKAKRGRKKKEESEGSVSVFEVPLF